MAPVDLLCRLHRGMVRCYPRPVREEFGKEMQAVFREAMASAWSSGRRAAFGLLIRELIDWPFAVFSAHFDTLADRNPSLAEKPMSEAALAGRRNTRWRISMSKRPFFAALPPVLLGLGIMASALIRTDVWYWLPTWQLYLSAAVPLVAGLVVAAMGLLAVLKRLPTWGVSWVGTAFMGSTLLVKVIVEEGTEEGWLLLPPLVQAALALAFLLAGGLLLLIMAKRGWEHAGLFTMAAAGTLGLSLLQSMTAAPFNRDDLALLAGPMGTLFGVLLYVYILRPGTRRIAALAGIGMLNAGVVLVTTDALESPFARRGSPSPLLPLLLIITGLLLAGPLTGVLFRPRRQP